LATLLNRFEVIADENLKFDPQAQITLSNKDGMQVYLQKRAKFY
jgi:hypothetical protein